MLNLFCIILYTTFWPNHWLEVHKCPYLQNSIQDRCWNTVAATRSMLKHGSCYTNPRMHMLKHGAATQSEDAYAETRSSYMVRGRCWNTKAVTQKYRCWDTVETATMLKHEPRQSAVKADTVKGRNSRGWNNPWIAMLKQHQQLCKEAVTPAVTATPCSALY